MRIKFKGYQYAYFKNSLQRYTFFMNYATILICFTA